MDPEGTDRLSGAPGKHEIDSLATLDSFSLPTAVNYVAGKFSELAGVLRVQRDQFEEQEKRFRRFAEAVRTQEEAFRQLRELDKGFERLVARVAEQEQRSRTQIMLLGKHQEVLGKLYVLSSTFADLAAEMENQQKLTADCVASIGRHAKMLALIMARM